MTAPFNMCNLCMYFANMHIVDDECNSIMRLVNAIKIILKRA